MSPFQRAQEQRRSPEFATLAEETRRHIVRVTDPRIIPVPIAEMLDREIAPFWICRWVAWGQWLQDRLVRLELALFLRREASLSNPSKSLDGWSWPTDPKLAASEKLFYASDAYKKLLNAGVLNPKGTTPKGPDQNLLQRQWVRVQEVVRASVRSFDHQAFTLAVEREVALRKKRRHRCRKVGDKERAAVQLFKRLVWSGDLTINELVDAVNAHDERAKTREGAGKKKKAKKT